MKVKDVKEMVGRVIKAEFPNFAIYADTVYQNMKKPCAIVSFPLHQLEQKLDIRYKTEFLVNVTIIPIDGYTKIDDSQEYAEVLQKALNRNSYFRMYNISSSFTNDDVLVIQGTITFRELLEIEAIKQGEIELDIKKEE